MEAHEHAACMQRAPFGSLPHLNSLSECCEALPCTRAKAKEAEAALLLAGLPAKGGAACALPSGRRHTPLIFTLASPPPHPFFNITPTSAQPGDLSPPNMASKMWLMAALAVVLAMAPAAHAHT